MEAAPVAKMDGKEFEEGRREAVKAFFGNFNREEDGREIIVLDDGEEQSQEPKNTEANDAALVPATVLETFCCSETAEDEAINQEDKSHGASVIHHCISGIIRVYHNSSHLVNLHNSYI